MRPILLLCLSTILLSACNHYQYLTVASNIPVNNRNEFVAETDSLLIIYNFHGPEGPVKISIHNKLNQGVTIDWKRSSLILGDRPIAFYNPDMQIYGVVENNRRRDNDIRGTIRSVEGTEFIPPASTITNSRLRLAENFYDTSNLGLRRTRISRGGLTMRQGKFNKFDSPIAFRSYLTFMTGNGESREFSVEHSFYISEFIDSPKQPSTEWLESDDKGNEFYIRGVANGGGGGAVLGVVAMVGVAYAMSQQAQ